MNTSDRIGLYTGLLETFLARAKEKGYIIIGVPGDCDAFVQYQLHGDRIYAEVGSRQWHDPERPLGPGAVAAIGLLGFTGGGPERNFAADGLPKSAAELAALTDRALLAAYGLDGDYSPVIREMTLNDVTFPRAEPFTRAIIEAHLRNHGAQFLRDEDGDFRVDLACDGDDEPVTIWLIAGGPADVMYRVTGQAPHRPAPSTRLAAMEAGNSWNAAHREVTAFLVDEGQSWRIMLVSDFDLSCGITRSLFDSITERAVNGILAFWSDLATSGAQEPSMTDDRNDA
jgi:hypothetical protein